MKRVYISKNHTDTKSYLSSSTITIIIIIFSFLLGSLITTTVILNYRWFTVTTGSSTTTATSKKNDVYRESFTRTGERRESVSSTVSRKEQEIITCSEQQKQQENQVIKRQNDLTDFNIQTILNGINILVVIVSYDFSQLPHLEEVIAGYHDVCITSGVSSLDIHIHTTIAYPITLIDIFNSRIICPVMTISIIIKPKSFKLHLVDCHRETFYNEINNYDLFIYTEDDIRITSTTIATYLYETKLIEFMIQQQQQQQQSDTTTTQLKPSDFNVGIVRYEYNYPSNVIIDDNTRHATQNVTRVYWEHSGTYERPNGIFPNAVRTLSEEARNNNRQDTTSSTDNTRDLLFKNRYITMKNHHQGMFLATRELLLAWKDRGPTCDFATIRNRPGTRAQPSQGTQRVWMSSHMLYGKKHCNVQQVLPVQHFGTLTVLHLPNKNYRRVGKYRNRTFADGTETFTTPHPSLLTAMQLHIALRQYTNAILRQQQQQSQQQSKIEYTGAVRMIDEVTVASDRTPLLERRMVEYEKYIARGGILSDDDMTKLDLVENY